MEGCRERCEKRSKGTDSKMSRSKRTNNMRCKTVVAIGKDFNRWGCSRDWVVDRSSSKTSCSPITLMLSSRLIDRVSQWLRLLSPRLPGGAILIISQPATLNPSPGALGSKWMKSPWMVFSLHSSTLQQRKRSEHPSRQVRACTDAQAGMLPKHFPLKPHLFSFRISPLTSAAVRGPETKDHTGGEEMYETGKGEQRRMTACAEYHTSLFSPIRSANPASGGADHHSHLPAPLHLVRGQMGGKVTSCCTFTTGLVPSH